MLTLRFWGEPQVKDTVSFEMPDLGRVEVEPVEWTPPEGPVQRLTLASCDVPGDDALADLSSSWRELAWAWNCFAFCRLCALRITMARAEPAIVCLGQPTNCRMHVGSPPPAGELHLPVGFPHQRRPVPLPAKAFRADVRSALAWFVRGLEARDPVEHTVFNWMALEALAKPTPDRVTGSIHDYVARVLPPLGGEVRSLYKLRSKLVHGTLERGSETARTLGVHLMRLTHIVMECLKREMGWPAAEPPVLVPEGSSVEAIESGRVITFNSEMERKWPLLAVTLAPIELDQYAAWGLGVLYASSSPRPSAPPQS